VKLDDKDNDTEYSIRGIGASLDADEEGAVAADKRHGLPVLKYKNCDVADSHRQRYLRSKTKIYTNRQNVIYKEMSDCTEKRE
jgi:hypothetical protein